MPEYHVGASDISGRIYAGEGKKDDLGICWGADKSDVTSEAINAVMAHMLYRMQSGKTVAYDEFSFAYMNKTRDGRYVRLKLEVSDTKPVWLDKESGETE